jgi:adenosylmethionine-8-amino-7-oxononanoate aminotransferase
VLINDRVSAPFVSGEHTYMLGLTLSGHPLSTAIASETIDIYEEVDALARVREHENVLSRKLNELRRIPLVGDVRGAGFFWAIEMVKDRNSKATFEGAEADWLLRDEMSDHMSALGLLCRLDDRGDPVIQLSPPLVADEALLDRMVDIVGSALEGAWSSWQGRAAA